MCLFFFFFFSMYALTPILFQKIYKRSCSRDSCPRNVLWHQTEALPPPHPKVHPGWLGSQVREPVLFLWRPPPCCLPLQPERRGLLSLEDKELKLSQKRGTEVCMYKVQKLQLLTGECIQVERKWNSAWIPSDLHNITRSCQSVITFPWQIKK